jgi:hypothetical protein
MQQDKLGEIEVERKMRKNEAHIFIGDRDLVSIQMNKL